MYTDIIHNYGYLIAAFLFSAACMVVYNRLTYYKQRRVTRRLQRLNTQLSLIMDANKSGAWTYDIKKNQFKVISKHDLTETLYTPFEFSKHCNRDDFLNIEKAIDALMNREILTETLTARSAPADGEELKYCEITLSVLRRNRKDMPMEILGTQRDITQETKRAEEIKNLMLRSQNVFNSSLVDMIYYDAKGYLADLNETACHTFGVKNAQALIKRGMKMNDIPSYRDIDVQKLEHTTLSSITDIAQVKATDERIPEVTVTSKMYYEVMLGPIRDQLNNLMGVIAAGRDITEMVESNHRMKESSRLIEERTKALQQYVRDINYSLKVSESRLTNYYPDCHELEILSDLSGPGKRIPQLHAVALIHKDDQRAAKNIIKRMDRRHMGTISETLHTKLQDKQGRDIYLNLNMMPITDKAGHVTHYFGILRNDTEMVHTELRLKEETAKAQEEEQLKNTFLLNMSYELRVPLQAVIGFAELFNTEHDINDERIFAEEIKKNTDVLLSLINDILFISRLDAHMIEYHYETCDFASLFEGWCQLGWSDVKQSIPRTIKNPYQSLVVNIDPQNLGLAIKKLCAYSGMCANQSDLKARYEYLHDELIIIVEDTGVGMDFDEVPRAFDRFAREGKRKRIGTGLDLPIVKEMAEQMGGTIDVLSEPAKGSTYFMSIPCEMISYVKK